VAGPDPRFVAAVFAAAGEGESIGSGYLIGDALVLTARHVVAGAIAAGTAPRVVFAEPPAGATADRLATEIAWESAALDACLLRITAPAWRPPPPAASRRWWWAEVIGEGTAAIRATGYPRAERDNLVAVRHTIEGMITLGTGGVSGTTFAVQVTNERPKDSAVASPWAGMSGAAVFAGPYLIAMLVRDPGGWEAERLDALRSEVLLQAPGFAEACEGAGVPKAQEIRVTTKGVGIPASPSGFEDGLGKELTDIGSASIYRKIASVLGFGDAAPIDADSAPVLAREIVANAGTVIDSVVEVVHPVSRRRAGDVYEWVAPWGWIPEDTDERLREVIDHEGRPRVVAVGVEYLPTVTALVRHAGGEYKQLKKGWRCSTFRWPEGEVVPATLVKAMRRSVEDLLSISPDDDGYEPDVAERRARKGVVFLVVPNLVQLGADHAAAIAADIPSPVLLFRCRASERDHLQRLLPNALFIDPAVDPGIEADYDDNCAEFRDLKATGS
jgi:hypothetical protein